MQLLKNKNDFGRLMILIGIVTLMPVCVIPFFLSNAKYFFAFFLPSLLSVLLGMFLCSLPQKKRATYYEGFSSIIKHSSLTVIFAWSYAIFIAAIPFLFLGNLNFIQALFESASSWTTTGLRVVNPEDTPQIFLFHKSFMQFCGGVGFVLMMVMIIQNKHSMSLFRFEGHDDQLRPSLIKTARMIFILYILLFLLGTVLYIICGMPIFDSIVNTMSALSTGGASTKVNSIAEYNSVLIEAVTILLMLLGMTNFGVLILLTKRKFKQVTKVSELRIGGLVFLISIPLIATSLFLGLSISFGQGLRYSIFNVVSGLSTTGFTTLDFSVIPNFAIFIFIMIMLIGGSAGSTSGGLKLNRLYLMFRGVGLHVKTKLSPNSRILTGFYYKGQGKIAIDDTLIKDTFVFSFLYFLTFVILALLLCVTADIGIVDSLFNSASITSTTGFSINLFDQYTNNLTLVVSTIGMLIARLEIITILTGICMLFAKRA
ncbi:MAG: TrkH family potassium uptake protein [Clostridiales bacterium]|jgi:trk system potassium uptake protein TrkH|nr:TrkH family potassium uptake protein [Clostridiales bacterium]